MLAQHGRRLLALLDDSAVVPGDSRPAYRLAGQARQILNDAEDDLRDWRPEPDRRPTSPALAPSYRARGRHVSEPPSPAAGATAAATSVAQSPSSPRVVRDETERSAVASSSMVDSSVDSPPA